jgi:hypothetical protein
MLLRPELSKNALTSGIFKSSLIAINSATGYYEYIVKLTFSVYLMDINLAEYCLMIVYCLSKDFPYVNIWLKFVLCILR